MEHAQIAQGQCTATCTQRSGLTHARTNNAQSQLMTYTSTRTHAHIQFFHKQYLHYVHANTGHIPTNRIIVPLHILTSKAHSLIHSYKHTHLPHVVGPQGLDVRDRRHLFKNYKNCFVGQEFIDWLLSKG